MTTEAAPAIELNETEQPNGPDEVVPTASEESPLVEENTEATTVSSDNKNPDETEGSNVSESPSSANVGEKSPGKQKKEKEVSDSKGISRFLPPWLKKQRSQSQTDSKEDGDKSIEDKTGTEEPAEAKEPKEKEERGEGEQVPEGQPEKSKAEEKEEKHSLGSGDTQQLAKEGDQQKVDEKEIKPEGEKDVKVVQPTEAKKEVAHKSPKKVKTVLCKVTLLDGTEYSCDIEKRAKGQILFNKVCEHLNLLETDYFGLIYRDNTDQKNWLDPAKEIKRQIRSSPWLFVFNVKFYPPDPSQLTEDITRYFLCLQLRQDIASGRLPCSFVTSALLGSYTLQAELGDYDADEHSVDYISDFQFTPNQTKEMEDKVVELHKTHRGLTPAQADIQFLENAKKLSMYGVDLHHAKDSEGVDIMLGVCANGLLIYKDRLRINRFAWPKILKISYKRSNFYIKVRPAELEQFESTIGFKLPNHRAAKRLWKVCVEHHTFYRLSSPEQPPKAKFLTLGSKFRYSGRTQAQTRDASTRIDRPAPYFERTSSKRVSRSLDGAPIGSITDQSLLKDYLNAEAGNAVDGIVSGPEVASEEVGEKGARLLQAKDAKSSDEIQNIVEDKNQADSDTRDAPITEEVKAGINGEVEYPRDTSEQIPEVESLDKKDVESLSSSESSSEEENEVVYKTESRLSEHAIDEELEENTEEIKEVEPHEDGHIPPVEDHSVMARVTHLDEITEVVSQEITVTTTELFTESQVVVEEEQHKINGDLSHIDVDASAQIICCSEPPVVKTEMVTISDAAQRTEISTKEVPIVQTETKTITYESAQLDGSGDNESGVLLSAQTITSDSVLTTTTTHITKTGKGGISETRIEKRIVISGDADIDHDEALAQAIKEAKEQHPDMSITRVVVHKETELTEEGEED
ncbi:band 4.1-like protein 2 isoform 11-T13 [Discoglossus pictus]